MKISKATKFESSIELGIALGTKVWLLRYHRSHLGFYLGRLCLVENGRDTCLSVRSGSLHNTYMTGKHSNLGTVFTSLSRSQTNIHIPSS